MKMVREEPPAAWGTRRVYAEIAEKLKADPGNWYRIDDQARSQTGTNIKNARMAAFRPAGSFEATSRKNDDGKTFTIWARYVGGNS